MLDITGSATDLGLVLAAGVVPQLLLFLFGGVIADRLPRNRVMFSADAVSGTAQLTAAAFVLSGGAAIWHLAILNAVRGGATAFFVPAAAGLTPQTVPAPSLQQANALLRLTASGTTIVGAAAGGILVAAVGPGWALGWDGATYLAGAVLVLLMRVQATERTESPSMLRELREGWAEFSSRRWLWSIVVAAAVGNMAFAMGWEVLGPVVAKRELGGASAWGFIVSALAAGFLVGGLIAFRVRPRRPLYLATAAMLVGSLGLVGLALGLPTWAIALGSFMAGAAFEIFGVFWDLSLQQHVPNERLSRVSSYDWLGSLIAIPIGQMIAGPLSDAIGIERTLWVAVALFVLPLAATFLVRDVRALERTDLRAAA